MADRDRTAKDNRTFVNGVLWMLRSGAYWCHMPKRYGNWKSNHKRFTRWSRAGVWEEIFEVLTSDSDNDCLVIDTTIVGVATSGKGEQDEVLGRSGGGLSTKINMLTETPRTVWCASATAGQTNDAPQADPLLEGVQPERVFADRGYDSEKILEKIEEFGALAVIPT